MRIKKKLLHFILFLVLGAIMSAVMNVTNEKDIANLQYVKTKTEQTAKLAMVKGVTSEVGTVKRVVDGDTFELDDGRKVRMIGVDTPELHHPSKPVQCFGQEAMEKTKELLEGKTVRMEKDVSETDRYGRLLRFVYIVTLSPTSTTTLQADEMFINAYLVKEGYAHVATFPPDVSKAEYFASLEKEANSNDKGLWSKCK